MTWTFPTFDEETWSGAFDSHDQRKGDVYYVVTLHEGRSFVACVDVERYGDDWSDPAFTDGLRDQLGAVARTGHPNTDYVPSRIR